jgi:F420-0:gamma-glutamyl ligase-like protein
MDLLNFDFTQLYLPIPVALAAVALLGYMVGRWHKPVS